MNSSGRNRRPRLLDLYCGAGGAATGYHRAGFEVVGVDLNPQPNYPFEFHQADALEFSLAGFDVVHASPPCQAYSTMTHVAGDRSKHRRLIDATRERIAHLPYVIENVQGAKRELLEPIRLCGSSFGLGVMRHRFFESNLPLVGLPCDHASGVPRYRVYDHKQWRLTKWAPVYGHGGGKAKEQWSEAMDIDWMTKEELTEAIPPAYTEYLGRQILEAL